MANPPNIERALEIGMAALAEDQRILAERKWRAPTKARKPQLPCDHGLFSDEADQLDLVSLFRE